MKNAIQSQLSSTSPFLKAEKFSILKFEVVEVRHVSQSNIESNLTFIVFLFFLSH